MVIYKFHFGAGKSVESLSRNMTVMNYYFTGALLRKFRRAGRGDQCCQMVFASWGQISQNPGAKWGPNPRKSLKMAGFTK